MKFGTILILLSFLMAGCSETHPEGSSTTAGPPSTDAVSKGNSIVGEYLDHDAATLRKQRVRFTIASEDEPVKIYEVDTWRKQSESETVTLTQIVKPAEDSDLASLTVEKKGESAIVTSFVASQDTFRETDTGKMFFGGLTAGELLCEWHKFDFRFLGEREVNGSRVYELEGKIRKGESSVVSRMIVLMRAAEPIPVGLQLFDAGERQIRTYRVVDVKRDAKGVFAEKTEVENPIYKTKIVIEVLAREFPDTVDTSFFSREKLREIATRKK